MPSYAPFVAAGSEQFSRTTAADLTAAYVDLFPGVNCLRLTRVLQRLRQTQLTCCLQPTSRVHPFNSEGISLGADGFPLFVRRYLTAATIFRGDISSREVRYELHMSSPADSRTGSSLSPWPYSCDQGVNFSNVMTTVRSLRPSAEECLSLRRVSILFFSLRSMI